MTLAPFSNLLTNAPAIDHTYLQLLLQTVLLIPLMLVLLTHSMNILHLLVCTLLLIQLILLYVMSVLDSINISENVVLAAINKLKNNLSAGPDDLHPLLFKRIKYSILSPLTIIFRVIICCIHT